MRLASNSIFISYRKDDAGGWASTLALQLREIVGQDAVFLDDTTGIPPGTPWPDQINIALSQCRIFLPVIAPEWHREPNLSWLKDPEDWVRRELLSAYELRLSLVRIPIFVNGALPIRLELFADDSELKAAIADLMKQQGFTLDRSPELWSDKIDALISRIETEIGITIRSSTPSSTPNRPLSVASSGRVVIMGNDRSRVTVDNSTSIHSRRIPKRGRFHSILNGWQGFFALIGILIAAMALWYQISGKGSSPDPDNSNTDTVLSRGNADIITNKEVTSSEIHVDTSTTINYRDPLVEETVNVLIKQLENKDEYITDQNILIRELTAAVEALTEEQGEPGAPRGIEQALTALSKGDTEEAERIFQSVAEREENQAQQSAIEAAEAWRHLGTLAYLHDTDKALDAYRRSTELDPDNATSWNRIGLLLYRNGDTEGAIQAFERMMLLGDVREDTELQAMAYGNLGLIHQARGEFDKAEVFHLKSLEISEKSGRQGGMANQYSNLGVIYKARGEFNKAEEYYLKGLEIEKTLGRQEAMMGHFGNLGSLYETLGELDKAEEFLLKSLKINETLGRQPEMASQYGNLGVIYQTRGELDKAEEFHLKALVINKSLRRQGGMASNYGNLGLIYRARGELDRAEKFLIRYLEIEKTLGRQEGMASAYGNLGLIYQSRGEFEKARKAWRRSLNFYRNVGARPQVDLVSNWIEELE